MLTKSLFPTITALLPRQRKDEDTEEGARKGASTDLQEWKEADAAREKIKILSSLYSMSGSLQPGSSYVLKGNASAEADTFRATVVQDCARFLAASDNDINQTLHPTNVLSVIESLEGVSTPSSMALRRFLLSSDIGAYFSVSLHREPFTMALLHSFKNTKGSGDDIFKDLWSRMLAMQNTDEATLAKLYEKDIEAGLAGSSTPFAKHLLQLVGKSPAPQEERITTDTASAWAKRRSYFNVALQDLKGRSGGEFKKDSYVDLEQLCFDFSKFDSEESWKFREELLTHEHVDKKDLLLSLGSLASAKAVAMGDALIARIFTDPYYISKAAVASQYAIPAQNFQTTIQASPLYSLMGKDSDLSWDIRKELVTKHKIPLSYVLATTVSSMRSEKADAFVEEMTKDMDPQKRRDLLLTSMIGSELPSVWKSRDAVIDELRSIDRLRIRTTGEKLTLLEKSTQERLVADIKPALVALGLTRTSSSTESIVSLLKRWDKDTFIDTLNDPRLEEFNAASSVDDIQTAYLSEQQSLMYHNLVQSLTGCTSEKGKKTRAYLKKHNVPEEAILGTIKGVFGKEAQQLRGDYLRAIQKLYSTNTEDGRDLCGHMMQVLITNLLLDGPSLEDTFTP